MHTNKVYSELATVNNGSNKWWHRRWVKIIGIYAVVLTIVAVSLALVLNFVVFASKKSETSTAATTLSSPMTTTPLATSTLLTITISTPSSLSTTTPLVTPTSTLPQTTTMITAEQSAWSDTGSMENARYEHTATV